MLIAAACACSAMSNCVTAALDELAPSHITLAKGLIAGTADLYDVGIGVDGAPGHCDAPFAALVVGGWVGA